MVKNILKFMPSIILTAFLFILWELLVRALDAADWFLPPPSSIIR